MVARVLLERNSAQMFVPGSIIKNFSTARC